MLQQIQAKIQKGLTVFENPIVYTFTVMFIGMYASIIAPRPGPVLAKLFDSTIFKLLFFFVVILVAHQEPRIALLFSLAFVFTMQGLTKLYAVNAFKRTQLSTKPSVIPAPSADTISRDAERAPGSEPEVAYDEVTADDGTIYATTGETEVGLPLHPDFVHSSPQALGDPIPGFDETDGLNTSPF